MKKLAVQWRSAVKTTGFVLMENEVGGVSCRVGQSWSSSEDNDITWIMEHGAKLSKTEALAFFPHFKERIEKDFKRN